MTATIKPAETIPASQPACVLVSDQDSMNCGSSAGTMENPARPRISAAHMAATTDTEGTAVADRARVTVPTRKPRLGGTGVLGVDDRAGGIVIDYLSPKKHGRGAAVHIPLRVIPARNKA